MREIRVVEWVDSAALTGWERVDDYIKHDISRCVSVGFVLRDDDDQVVLVQSEDTHHDGLNAAIAIPRVAIIDHTTIKAAT